MPDLAQDLILTLDAKAKSVRTRGLDLSFNELLDMYAGDELIIRPEYQRLFKWSIEQRSRFIESLLLELPTPPIYVVEVNDGIYELIDGLQRISSYLHFRGVLREKPEEFLRLQGCDLVPQLNGVTYQDLEKALKIKLKRHYVRVQAVGRDSDPHLRYHLFKRLNRGGELLTAQELRNCTIRLLGECFANFIISTAREQDFVTCMSLLSDARKESMELDEYVLRYFAFKNYRANYDKNIGEFLDEYMEKVTDSTLAFDYDEELRQFRRTFSALAKTLGELAFSGVNPSGKLTQQFRSLHYEAVAIGVHKPLERIDLDSQGDVAKLKNALMQLKNDKMFADMTTGGGKNYSAHLAARIEYAQKFLSGHL